MTVTQDAMADDRERLERFVHAIARPTGRTLVLTKSNKRVKGWRGGISAAIAKDVAFATQLRDEFVALDIDIADTGERGLRLSAAAAVVDDIRDQLFACQIPHLVLDSGTGWHIIMVLGAQPKALRNRLRVALMARGDHIDVREGHTGKKNAAMLRPPYSRHRNARCPETGQAARSRPHNLTPEAALAILEGPAAATTSLVEFVEALEVQAPITVGGRAARATLTPIGSISATTRAILDGSMPPLKSRSEPAWGVVCSAERAGHTPDTYVSLVEGTWLETYYRHKLPGNWQARAHEEFGRAVKTAAATTGQRRSIDPTEEAIREEATRLRLAALEATGLHTRWWREGGHAVLDTILDLVSRTGERAIHLSVREAALRSGMSKSAAHRHLTNLESAGIISRTPSEERHLAMLVTVNDDALCAALALPTKSSLGVPPRCPTSAQLEALGARNADAFAARGLGKAAWKHWVTSMTPHVPDGRNCPKEPHRKIVQRLNDSGLIDVQGRGLFDTDVLADAARRLGVAGLGALRAIRYAEECDRFKEVIAMQSARTQR